MTIQVYPRYDPRDRDCACVFVPETPSGVGTVYKWALGGLGIYSYRVVQTLFLEQTTPISAEGSEVRAIIAHLERLGHTVEVVD
jgi:hypothetical protein